MAQSGRRQAAREGGRALGATKVSTVSMVSTRISRRRLLGAATCQQPVTVRALLDPSLVTLFGESAPVLPTFKEANPHVTLDVEAGPGPSDGNLAMISKFKAKIASGEQLDVYANAASDTVSGFAKAGLLKDLGPMMARQSAVRV